jgi:hypothetical protein
VGPRDGLVDVGEEKILEPTGIQTQTLQLACPQTVTFHPKHLYIEEQ